MTNRFWILIIELAIIIGYSVSCFNKPIKPDLPPEIVWFQPSDGMSVIEGSTVVFELKGQDDRRLEMIKLYLDGTIVDSVFSDSIRYSWVTTGAEGVHSWYFYLRDTHDQIIQTELALLTVQPFSFQVMAPDNDYFIVDTLSLWLRCENWQLGGQLSVLGNEIQLNEPFDLHKKFQISLDQFSSGAYNTMIRILDNRQQLLTEQEYTLIKVNDAVLSFPDTLLAREPYNFVLPLRIQAVQRLYSLDFKVLFYKDVIVIDSVKPEGVTSQYLAFSTTLLSSPEQMSVTFRAKPGQFVDGDHQLFKFFVHRGAQSYSDRVSLLKFTGILGNGGALSVYGNNCRIWFE